MKTWKTASWRERLKLIAFGLLPAAIILALAQGCAYLTTHRTISETTDAITGQSYYSMKIGQWPWSYRSITPINSIGLPDDEFTGLVPKGACIHVLLAGDSFTFGDAMTSYYRWGTLLQSMTARRIPDRCIRFFNIGVRNTTIDTTIVRIRQVLPLIDPDVVILGQYQNDLTDLANPGSPAWVPATGDRPDSHWGTRLGRLVPGYNISLVRFLTYNSFSIMIQRDIKYDVLGTWSVLEGDSKREFAERLKTIYHGLYGSLVQDMRSRQIEFGVIVLPSKMDLLAKRSPEGEYFVGLAKEFGVPHLSLFPALDAQRAGMPFHLYDGHMNELGNRVVATAVWDWLFATVPPPIPSLANADTAGTSAALSRPER